MIFGMSGDELWVVATCAVCAAACAIPGVFLILSRSSLLGDAISHAALPGIALAFIVSGGRNPIVMLAGAAIAGLLTTILSGLIHRNSLVKPDAALGIVFTTFFSLGVILLSVAARQVDLDPGCVLYGLAEFTPFDTVRVFSNDIPRSFLWLSVALIFNCTIVILCWKELIITTFDPALARTLGYSPTRMYYGLLGCVTATVVASFEAVGSILVISMLVAPGATALLLSESIGLIVILAASLGILSAIGGFLTALSLNTSVAGMMSVVSGALFMAALIFSPSQGLVHRFVSSKRLQFKIVRDDILGLLFRWHELALDREPTPLKKREVHEAIISPLLTRLALLSLTRSRYVLQLRDGDLRLSEKGLVEARALVRSHRLWEAYLAKHLGLPLDHVHAPSERTEHFIGRALARDIAQDVEAKKDPHGKAIP